MITTLAWKDYREHLPVWGAMAGLAIFLIVVLTQVFAPHGVAGAPVDKLQTIALAALIVTASYGLICGAMMVAGETEAKTQTFLDMLPAGRMRLWITKFFMGALFTLAQALVVTGLVVFLGLTEVKALPAGWQLALPLVGVEAFVYGLFGSVLGRSVLGACGWALVPAAVGWVLGGAPDWPPAVHPVRRKATRAVDRPTGAGRRGQRWDHQTRVFGAQPAGRLDGGIQGAHRCRAGARLPVARSPAHTRQRPDRDLQPVTL